MWINLFFGLLLLSVLAKPTEDCLITLDSNTFDKSIKDPNSIWFIMFHAPWCGHCKRLHPIWIQLAKDLCDNSNVHIGTIDT